MLAKYLRKLFLIVAFLSSWSSQATAGTTGVLAGTVRLSDGKPVAGAHVTAETASDTRTVVTDASGYFVFLSLAPDSYKVTTSKSGYDMVSISAVRVLADNTRTLSLVTRATVVLGVVTIRPSASLLQAGVVADVYSVNEQRANKTQLLGGGGNVDNIYSALSAVPGVIVPPGQNGANQIVNMRGAGFNGVGYEYDGVPVNRSFDNESGTVGSNLGQRELQVYVGTAPANAAAFGLGGFINQVIKSGSYPGFATLSGSMQSPNLFNGVRLEVGGATPTRSFSYYVALGGYTYSPRYYDNFDGASVSQLYGFPLDLIPCSHDPTGDSSVDCYQNSGQFGLGPNGNFGPGGFILTPFNFFNTSLIADREAVTNFHFRIPHRHDEGNDDIQLLYSSSLLRNPIYSSSSDLGQAFFAYDKSVGGSIAYPAVFVGTYQYQGAVGQALSHGCLAPCDIVPYSFPSSRVAPNAPIPLDQRDSGENASGLIKLQYQRNFGSRAYLRVYGYSLYSSFITAGPNEAQFCDEGTGAGCEFVYGADYELSTHTRGASAIYTTQLDDRNLISLEGSYVTATTLRDYNRFLHAGPFAVLVDSKAPESGFCFQLSGALGSCEPNSNNPAAFLRLGKTFSNGASDVSSLNCDPGVAGIPAGACEWLVVEKGISGPYNQVRPAFTSVSLIDQIRASSALQLNAGLRFDRFVFAGASTTGPARDFWFTAWNQNECFSANAGVALDKLGDLGLSSPAVACPSGTVPATMRNASAQVFSYSLLEPRLGGTYTLGDNNVLRLNYSEIAQPPKAAYEQYNYQQQNLPAALQPFYPFGFNTPGHALGPSVAYTLDFSWEHRVRGSDLEFKLTPYVRKTKDQYENLVLDQRTGFSTALPAAKQTSDGIEFELQKGSFGKSGLSWIMIYNYFHNVINYTPFANGVTFQTANNNAIRQYNAYTSFCAGNATSALCGSPTDGQPAAACYDVSGNPAACAPGVIANPYWNAPAQHLFGDAAIPTGARSHTATLVLNYKAGSFSLTPSFQFFGGYHYGDPLSSRGIDPASGCSALAGAVSGDTRYPYGAPGGSPYDATSCRAYFAIPDPYTHLFDGANGFTTPAQLLMNLQLTYDATPRLQFTIGATNLINTCWGGSTAPWTAGAASNICFYNGNGGIFKGNFYNPDSIVQPLTRFPYAGGPGNAPVSLMFQTAIKL